MPTSSTIDPERRYVLDRAAVELANEIREDFDLLTTEEVCGLLKVEKRTLRGLGIPCVEINARVRRYRRADVRSYIESKTFL